jgi:hypothetical protein
MENSMGTISQISAAKSLSIFAFRQFPYPTSQLKVHSSSNQPPIPAANRPHSTQLLPTSNKLGCITALPSVWGAQRDSRPFSFRMPSALFRTHPSLSTMEEKRTRSIIPPLQCKSSPQCNWLHAGNRPTDPNLW